eukprot:1897737-Pleurochrysis_carterae.AAC.1
MRKWKQETGGEKNCSGLWTTVIAQTKSKWVHGKAVLTAVEALIFCSSFDVKKVTSSRRTCPVGW